MLLGLNLTKSRRIADIFDVLTVIQSGPLPGNPDSRPLLLNAILVWLAIFSKYGFLGVLGLDKSPFR